MLALWNHRLCLYHSTYIVFSNEIRYIKNVKWNLISIVMENWRIPLAYFSLGFGISMHMNIVLILIFSILWAFFLIRSLWKDYRKEKQDFKLRNTVPEYQWLNTMNNFRSNRVKNCLLLSICLAESGMSGMLISNQLITYLLVLVGNIKDKIGNLEENTAHFATYDDLERFTLGRLYSISILTTICLLAFLVRILTQYMVYQYSYFKPCLNLKFEIYISLSCLFFLFSMATFLQLLMIFYVCTVFLLFYEYILLIIASRKLCLLLKQRLSDAILHENQSNNVIHYYRIGYKDYKICSTVMLISLFLQYFGVSLYGIELVVFAMFEDNLGKINDKNIYILENVLFPFSNIDALILILLTLGTSIQILVYLIVSIRRLFRYIKSRVNIKGQTSSQRSFIQYMIERNHMAYRMKNEFWNLFSTWLIQSLQICNSVLMFSILTSILLLH